VRSFRPGDTAVVVSYRGNVLPVRVMVPLAAEAGVTYPQVPEVNYVDHEVFAKLRRLNIVPSDLSGDAEFLRRVTIDTIGTLPSPDEVRSFLADKDPMKREKKIDELLAHPLHAALWATKFSDATGNNTDALENPQALRPRLSQQWHDWLRKRFAENVPYDEIVRGILCANSREGLPPSDWIAKTRAADEVLAKSFEPTYADRQTLDLFWRRQQPVTIDQWGEKTAAAFLGVRLECAQCHKHPFDRWTQADYRAYANVFSQVNFSASPEAAAQITAANGGANVKGNNQARPLREVWIGPPAKGLTNPDTNAPLPPKAPGGPEFRFTKEKSPDWQPGPVAGSLMALAELKSRTDRDHDVRTDLMEWLRSKDNPFFARAMVNRIWGHYTGVGIVDPVDNFALANPPSNPKLLDALAQDFIDHQFDVRHVERTILNSRVYQLASATNATNKLDKNNYSHGYVRPMMAEAVVDVLNEALGTAETFGPEAAPGAHTVEIGASRVNNANLAYVLRIFGRPPRTTACDCERAMEPALPQKLFLMSNDNVQGKIKNGRLQKLLASKTSDDEVLEELFLATLSRYPTDADRKLFAEYRKKAKTRDAAFNDSLWALINTREFILNH
jgi:hypothetical protein